MATLRLSHTAMTNTQNTSCAWCYAYYAPAP